LGNLGNLGRNEAAQVHVHLHHQPINESSTIDIEVKGVRGRSEVEVAENAPRLGLGGKVLP